MNKDNFYYLKEYSDTSERSESMNVFIEKINRNLQYLCPFDQEIFQLYYFDHLSLKQIAKFMFITYQAVNLRKIRIKEKLELNFKIDELIPKFNDINFLSSPYKKIIEIVLRTDSFKKANIRLKLNYDKLRGLFSRSSELLKENKETYDIYQLCKKITRQKRSSLKKASRVICTEVDGHNECPIILLTPPNDKIFKLTLKPSVRMKKILDFKDYEDKINAITSLTPLNKKIVQVTLELGSLKEACEQLKLHPEQIRLNFLISIGILRKDKDTYKFYKLCRQITKQKLVYIEGRDEKNLNEISLNEIIIREVLKTGSYTQASKKLNLPYHRVNKAFLKARKYLTIEKNDKESLIEKRLKFFFNGKINDSDIDSIKFLTPLRKDILKSLLVTDSYIRTAILLNLRITKVQYEVTNTIKLLKMILKSKMPTQEDL